MEWVSGNVFIRPMGGAYGLARGEAIKGHAHNFEHTSVFFSGRWEVRRWYPAVSQAGTQLLMEDGTPAWVLMDEFERDAPFHLLIDRNCRHEFRFTGMTVPDWMEPFIGRMSEADAEAFRSAHEMGMGKAWCVYSHRSAQGDVTEAVSGWPASYI